MKNIFKLVLCIAVFLISTSTIQAQHASDTIARKNTIKLDITSYWLYRKAVVFAYERVIKNRPYQTWGVTAGYQQFPPLGLISDVNVLREVKSSGLKFGAEYRFYLKKENKFGAPRGVYIGPYTSLHKYSNNRSIEVNNNGVLEYADLKTNLSILNIGFQLGYQFVLNNRWALDMVFVGPSVSNYRFKSSVEGNYTFNADDITNEVLLGLMDKYPGFKQLINDHHFDANGKVNTWAYGYRYQFQVGYHFGRKKK